MAQNYQSYRNCPYCGGELAPGARKCRHCGEWVEREADDIYYTSPGQGGHGESLPGFFQTYFIDTFCLHFTDFAGKTARKTFWLSLLAMAIITCAVAGTAEAVNVLMGFPGDGSLTFWITLVWVLLFICPFAALFARRLRDAGYSPYWALALGVPVIGWLMMILLGCMPSRDYPYNPSARFSGVDVVILILCIVLSLAGTLFDAFGAGFSYDDRDSFEGDTVYETDTTSLFQETEEEQAVTVAPGSSSSSSSVTEKKDTTKSSAGAAPAAGTTPTETPDGNGVQAAPAAPEPDPNVW